MDLYKQMIAINRQLINGDVLSERYKIQVVNAFLAGISDKKTMERFHVGMRFPGNIDKGGRRMYPIFFIPPYNNGKKYPLVTGQKPKTHILSANAYELEIIRLLHLFVPDNAIVSDIVSQTLERLKTTCFGNMDDGLGECFDASLVVLRFLACAAPDKTGWINERILNYHRHFAEKRRHRGVKWYFWLCLSELPEEIAYPEIVLHMDELLESAVRSVPDGRSSEDPDSVYPALSRIIHGLLTRLPHTHAIT